MKILELMKTHIIKTTANATMRDMVDMMDLYQITVLPVVDEEQRLLGVVTENAVSSKVIPEYFGKLSQGDEGPLLSRDAALVNKLGEISAAELMDSPAPSVDENEDVRHAAELMTNQKLTRLPVTSEGRLIGTISRIDICQALLEGQI
jgi:CBS domain-containing protein